MALGNAPLMYALFLHSDRSRLRFSVVVAAFCFFFVFLIDVVVLVLLVIRRVLPNTLLRGTF